MTTHHDTAGCRWPRQQVPPVPASFLAPATPGGVLEQTSYHSTGWITKSPWRCPANELSELDVATGDGSAYAVFKTRCEAAILTSL